MSEENVVQFKKKRTPRIGVVIFILIFVYIVVNIILYYNKDHLAMYEVQSEDIVQDNIFTGVAVRNEALVYTESAGYISCYVSDKHRVSKGTPVYSVDETNILSSVSIGSDGDIKLDETDIQEMKNLVYEFKNDFDTSDYAQTRSFKDSLTATFNELVQLKLFELMQEQMSQTSQTGSLEIMQSNVTGVISYEADSLTGLTLDQVSADTFNLESYTTNRLRTDALSSIGTPVYRIVTDENWNIVVNISEDFYIDNLETKTVNITVLDDNYDISAPAEFIKKGDAYFAVISLEEYMVRYIDKRYLSIEFAAQSDNGLKLPLSAITYEDFYVIPNEYFKTIEGYSSAVLVSESFDSSTGEVKYTYVEPTVYYNNGEASYIDMTVLDAGTYIYDPDTESEFRVTTIERLEGVYNVNKGYAVFRRIERIRDNGEYCIIKTNTSYGVSVYDHIALDAQLVDNAAIIY